MEIQKKLLQILYLTYFWEKPWKISSISRIDIHPSDLEFSPIKSYKNI
jgi:hypothetical protein